MEHLRVSTVVHVPPEEAFEFLLDLPGYAEYSEYLESVNQQGDGSVETQYELVLSWWKLTYTARSRVTDVDPPERIDWTLLGGLDADGCWLVEPASGAVEGDGVPGDGSADGPEDPEPTHASRITLEATYDPDSMRDASLDLPLGSSVEWVIRKAAPLARREARRIVERVVADLEGEPREVTLEIATEPA